MVPVVTFCTRVLLKLSKLKDLAIEVPRVMVSLKIKKQETSMISCFKKMKDVSL